MCLFKSSYLQAEREFFRELRELLLQLRRSPRCLLSLLSADVVEFALVPFVTGDVQLDEPAQCDLQSAFDADLALDEETDCCAPEYRLDTCRRRLSRESLIAAHASRLPLISIADELEEARESISRIDAEEEQSRAGGCVCQ